MRPVVLFLVLLLACFIGGALFLKAQQRHPSADMIAGGAPGAPTWSAPEFEFTDQLGRPVSSKTLKGQPYIASFLFTTCRTLCPLLSAKLVMLQRKLTQPSLRFVSFSVDPAHDTQDALAEWHDRWNAAESRWVLARTQPDALATLADGFGVAVDKGDTVEDPIIHSGSFLLVDATGTIVGAFDSTDEDALKRLEAAVDSMLGAGAPIPTSVDGAKLVHAVGCLGCHLDPALAPPLQGVGRTVLLDTGAHVEVDAAYLRESIVSPAAKRVNGYSVVMPAYGKRLTAAQIDAIVSFLAAQPVLAETPAAQVVEDPVCHMKVRVVDSTPHVETDGGVAYFCSPTCRETFLNRH